MTKRYIFIVFLFLLIFAGTLFGFVPKRIVIGGNKIIKTNEIKDIIDLNTNADYSIEDLDAAVSSLMETGYFSSVVYAFNEENGYLSFDIKEYPQIKIAFEYNGPELLSKNELKKLILPIENEKPFNPAQLIYSVPQSIEVIKEKFAEGGYFEPFLEVSWKSDPSREELLQEDFNEKYEVTFVISPYYLYDVVINTELTRPTIDKIKEQSGIKTLKSYFQIPAIIRWINPKKEYVPKVEDLQLMLQNIYSTYYFNPNGKALMSNEIYQNLFNTYTQMLNNAFRVTVIEDEKLNAKSMTVSLMPHKYLTGSFMVNGLFVGGNTLVPSSKLLKEIDIEEGSEVFSEKIAESLENIYALYQDADDPFVSIRYELDNKFGFLTYNIHEPNAGEVSYSFIGEQKTKDYLIEDKIVVKSGDKLTLEALQNSYGNLNTTSYFKSITPIPQYISDDVWDINFQIEDKTLANKFMGGGGWNDGFYLNADIGLVNPWGYGQTFTVSTYLNFPVGDAKTVVETTNDGTATTVTDPIIDLTFDYSIPRIFKSNFDLSTGFNVKFDGDTVTTETSTEIESKLTYTKVTDKSKQQEYRVYISPDYNLTPNQKVGFNFGYDYIIRNSSVSTLTQIESDEPTTESSNVVNNFAGFEIGADYTLNTMDALARTNSGMYLRPSISAKGLFGKYDNAFLDAGAVYKTFVPLGDPVLGLKLQTEQLFPVNKTGDIFDSFLLSTSDIIKVNPDIQKNSYYGVTGGTLQLRFPVNENIIPVDMVIFGDLAFYRDKESKDLIGTDMTWDAGLSAVFTVPVVGMFGVGYGYNSYNAGLKDSYFGEFFFMFGPGI